MDPQTGELELLRVLPNRGAFYSIAFSDWKGTEGIIAGQNSDSRIAFFDDDSYEFIEDITGQEEDELDGALGMGRDSATGDLLISNCCDPQNGTGEQIIRYSRITEDLELLVDFDDGRRIQDITSVPVDDVACLTDWNGDDVVNAADVGAFLSDYFLDLVNGTTIADFDGNGVTNTADVGAFLSVYFIELSICE